MKNDKALVIRNGFVMEEQTQEPAATDLVTWIEGKGYSHRFKI